MKILHIIPAIAPSYGGPCQAVFEMCRALMAQGIETEIATTNADSNRDLEVPLRQKTIYHKVPIYFFPRSLKTEYKFSWSFTNWLKENIRQYELLHIHSIFCYSTAMAAYYARKFKIPYIVRPTGMLDDWPLRQNLWKKRLYLHLIERKTLRGAATIQYTSLGEKATAEKLSLGSRGVVIPLGVDIPSGIETQQKGAFRKKYPQCADKKLIVFLSRIDPKKGFELLIPALSQLLKIRIDFVFVIAGSGRTNDENAVKRQIKTQGLEPFTIFTGFLNREEKYALLTDADLFILPSFSENFSLATLEAMASGVPVLLSERVGLQSDVVEAKAGVVVKTDKAQFAEAIVDLLSHPDTMRKMGENGRKLFQEKFTWEKVARQLTDLYCNVMAEATRCV